PAFGLVRRRVEASPIFIALRPHFRSRGALWITGDEEDVQMLLLVQFHLDVSEGFVVLHRPPWLMARAHPHAPLKFSLDNTIRIDFDGHPVWMTFPEILSNLLCHNLWGEFNWLVRVNHDPSPTF